MLSVTLGYSIRSIDLLESEDSYIAEKLRDIHKALPNQTMFYDSPCKFHIF